MLRRRVYTPLYFLFFISGDFKGHLRIRLSGLEWQGCDSLTDQMDSYGPMGCCMGQGVLCGLTEWREGHHEVDGEQAS